MARSRRPSHTNPQGKLRIVKRNISGGNHLGNQNSPRVVAVGNYSRKRRTLCAHWASMDRFPRDGLWGSVLASSVRPRSL